MSRAFFVALVFLICASPASAYGDGTIYITPARGQYRIGDEFEIEIRAATGGERIRAAEADLKFNPDAIDLVSISTEGSILSQWATEPSFSNGDGSIRFSGSTARPYMGDDGLLVTLRLRAESTLPGNVTIESGALLNTDARATNILGRVRNALYTIIVQAETAVARDAVEPEPQPEVAGVQIEVPSISRFDERIGAGDRIVLIGDASPDTKLIVYLQYEDEAPMEETVFSTRDGRFTFVSKEKAAAGTYTAWAEVESGGERFTSDRIRITAERMQVAAAASNIALLAFYALPLVVIFAIAGIAFGHLYNRARR